MYPEQYSRRILLCVSGLSPQIVTETLYALTVTGEPRFVPTEIHLLTTADGAERARLTLLSEEPGWFHRLRQDYGLPDIRFTLDSLHILRDANGRPLRDIREVADNEAIANAMTARLRDSRLYRRRAQDYGLLSGLRPVAVWASTRSVVACTDLQSL